MSKAKTSRKGFRFCRVSIISYCTVNKKQMVSQSPVSFSLIACLGSVPVKVRCKPCCICFYTQGVIACWGNLVYIFYLLVTGSWSIPATGFSWTFLIQDFQCSIVLQRCFPFLTVGLHQWPVCLVYKYVFFHNSIFIFRGSWLRIFLSSAGICIVIWWT